MRKTTIVATATVGRWIILCSTVSQHKKRAVGFEDQFIRGDRQCASRI
jgi:hypothetical protein